MALCYLGLHDDARSGLYHRVWQGQEGVQRRLHVPNARTRAPRLINFTATFSPSLLSTANLHSPKLPAPKLPSCTNACCGQAIEETCNISKCSQLLLNAMHGSSSTSNHGRCLRPCTSGESTSRRTYHGRSNAFTNKSSGSERLHVPVQLQSTGRTYSNSSWCAMAIPSAICYCMKVDIE
jgi:hypothetical protein